jgi:putative endonuclease
MMKFVYILESETGSHFYVGLTDDVDARLRVHNGGSVTHTSKYRPWRLRTYFAFSDANRAVAFEKYLKTASGRAFSTKRF